MFFKLISRNSKRSRKENGLFFATLLISIVAFYVILSLSHQDVMIFLAQMESDAVNKLLKMIPMFYGATLFILFFLVYFASRFQLERRRHEFGVYLMMGMSRAKLFFMLLAEDLRSSAVALIIGLPAAILISELTSLITARLVGLGIIGHRISISVSALIWTAAGFLLIKLFAFLILSGKIVRQEIGSMLVDIPEATKKPLPAAVYALAFITGAGLLAGAYWMAINGMAWNELGKMGLTIILGLGGTILLFYGLRFAMGFLAGRSGKKNKLQVFTYRQLEENIIRRTSTIAVSSLLILAALCCFGSGVAIAWFYGESEQHVLDYTFIGDENPTAMMDTIKEQRVDELFVDLFEMKIGYIRITEDYDNAFRMDSVMDWLEEQPDSQEKEVLLNNLGYADYPHLISLSDYNQLLETAGLPAIELKEKEAAVYMDTEFADEPRKKLLNRVLAEGPQVELAGEEYCLTGTVQSTSVVVDRSITLSFALILPDEEFKYFTKGDYSVYLNGVLDPGQTQKKSLLTAISETNKKLNDTGLVYESYLQNIGRQLFYVVAASYITIYLAIVLLIIANTVIGVQFLTTQQKTNRRYKTLIRLGASYQTLCQCAGRQIRWYFGIPTVVAAISSLFGIRALFTGLLSSRTRTADNLAGMMMISVAMILLLCVVECIYIAAVKTSSNRYLLTLMVPEREE